MVRFIRLLLNEKGRFLWSAHRITGKQKAGKARNIKEKQLKNSRKADLLLYMEFLVERQNRMKAIPDLKYEDYELKNTIQKAAQKPVAYRKE